LVAAASGCFVASPVMRFGGGKSAQESQQSLLLKETPPTLVADGEWKGEVKSAKIRVWADDDFRAQNIRWEQAFKAELDYANEVLAAQFGVRLEAEFHAWDRHAPEASLADDLAALEQQDRGDGALSVVGLTSSLSLVSATFEQLGLASLPGRHLMLRGYADVEERKLFERLFHDLGLDERASLYTARRRHKTAALLLHELGHNLGAQHQPDPNTLMNKSYSDHAASFDAASRDVILATLDQRLARTPRVTGASHPTLAITIDAAGRRIVGGNPLDDATLDGLLKLSFDDDRDTAVVIKRAPNAPQGAVVDVARRAKAAGLQRVSVVAGE